MANLDRHALKKRADWNASIRAFFKARDVLEVTTPILSKAAATDPALISFQTKGAEPYYLQTSPEFPMKRLLAANSGDIYQIASVFRDEEKGRWHQPEFQCLEWYRVGWDHHQLQQEVCELFSLLCPSIQAPVVQRYAALFEQTFDLSSMHETSLATWQALAAKHLHASSCDWDSHTCQDALLDGVIVPTWQQTPCVVLQDYPASQAALAKIDRSTSPPVAMRFEVFVFGIECANGFCELNDAHEQRVRFEAENVKRRTPVPLDEDLLASLDAMPDCAGVAVGLDRLFALSQGKEDLASILPFPH